MIIDALSPVVETKEEEEAVCFGHGTIACPQTICLVIDVYLGHPVTLDPEIINFHAFHSWVYESPPSHGSVQSMVMTMREELRDSFRKAVIFK